MSVPQTTEQEALEALGNLPPMTPAQLAEAAAMNLCEGEAWCPFCDGYGKRWISPDDTAATCEECGGSGLEVAR